MRRLIELCVLLRKGRSFQNYHDCDEIGCESEKTTHQQDSGSRHSSDFCMEKLRFAIKLSSVKDDYALENVIPNSSLENWILVGNRPLLIRVTDFPTSASCVTSKTTKRSPD